MPVARAKVLAALIPTLKRTEGDRSTYERVAAQVLAEWEAMLGIYERMASPELRPRVKRRHEAVIAVSAPLIGPRSRWQPPNLSGDTRQPLSETEHVPLIVVDPELPCAPLRVDNAFPEHHPVPPEPQGLSIRIIDRKVQMEVASFGHEGDAWVL
jgi:hypothetical protein